MILKFNRLSFFLLAFFLILGGKPETVSAGKRGDAYAFSLPKKDKKKTSSTVLSEELQRKYDYFFLEATRLRINGDYAASLDMLEHCLALKPGDPASLYELSQYYLVLKNESKGMRYLETAVRNDPDNYWFASGLVNMYLQRSRLDDAARLLEDMSERFPSKVDTYYLLMQIYDNQQAYEKEIAMLDRLEQMTEKSEQFTMQKVNVYDKMGDGQGAVREILNLIEQFPTELDYVVLLGDQYLKNGQPDEALEAYTSVLAKEKDHAMASYSMASYYEKIGDKESYQKQLDDILLNPKVESTRRLDVMDRYIEETDRTEGGVERITALLDKMMEMETENPDIPLLYAQYLYSKNMREKAAPVLEKTLEIDPTNSAARMTLLGDAVRALNYPEIIRLCKQGTQSNPDELEFYYYLAIAYNHDGMVDEVITTCKEAISQVKDETDRNMVSDFYAILGDSYHQKGLKEEAFQAYDTCLEYNSSNISALNNYAYYLSLERRDLDRAEEMSYKTIKAEPKNATYLDTYAWILFEKESYVQAKIYIDNAVKSDTIQSADILEHCGDIYYMNNLPGEALEFWNKAKSLGGSSDALEEKIRKKQYVRE